MEIRTLVVSMVAILAATSVSPAQAGDLPQEEPQPASLEPVSPGLPQLAPLVRQPEVPSRYRTPRTSGRYGRTLGRTPDPNNPMVVRIFRLEYMPSEDAVRLVGSVLDVRATEDRRSNSLIVSATKDQIDSVESLIAAMDVADAESSTAVDVQNLIYRVYMFEVHSGDQTMKPFSMILRASDELSSTDVLQVAEHANIQVSDFLISDDSHDEQIVDILIQGRAPSDESVRQFVESTPNVLQLRELNWDDDETFTSKIAAAQYTRLPEQVQVHLKKFLGDEVRTVGYWFGNSSAPGEVEAPIGPWTLRLRLDVESDRMLELDVDVEVPGERHYFQRRLRLQPDSNILSNTVRAKIGKPIIIGYNRESYGTRKMGAMVIVPEQDSL